MYGRRDGWLSAMVGHEVVMMSAESGAYLGLNEVGAKVWELIETPRTLAEICAALAEAFETTAEACRPEVETFLADLQAHGAVSRTI